MAIPILIWASTVLTLFGNIFSGGGNYETGFIDWVLAWSPEVEEWQVVGNMLSARYAVYLAICCPPGIWCMWKHALSQVCGVSGNMLAARYIRCICWHLPQSVSQLVRRFSHQLLLNISVQHLTSLPMQCYGCCRGCAEELTSPIY